MTSVAAEAAAGAARIEKLEREIKERRAQLLALRKELAGESVKEYTLTSSSGGSVKLSELFGHQEELMLIHNIGIKCDYCSLWADGINGLAKQIESRCALVVATPDDPETQRRIAAAHGWKFRMVSHAGTTFAKDLGFEPEPGKHWPGVSTLRRHADGTITRSAWAHFGPGDDYCAIWHLFDLLPRGGNSWEPLPKAAFSLQAGGCCSSS